MKGAETDRPARKLSSRQKQNLKFDRPEQILLLVPDSRLCYPLTGKLCSLHSREKQAAAPLCSMPANDKQEEAL